MGVMGNSANRREANSVLKKHGSTLREYLKKHYPKAWAKKKHLVNLESRKIINLSNLKPGDIVLGCDGNNKKICSYPEFVNGNFKIKCFQWEFNKKWKEPAVKDLCTCVDGVFNIKKVKTKLEIINEIVGETLYWSHEEIVALGKDAEQICADNGMMYFPWRNGWLSDVK